MSNEEFQKLVLIKLDELTSGQQELTIGQQELTVGQQELRSEVANIKTDILNIKADILDIKANMATKDFVERIVTEQQEDVKALLKIMDEKITKVANIVEDHSKILNLLSTRSIKHEAELEYLKLAK